MKSHLQVKVVSMSAEMTYIRKQELRWKNRARIARQRHKESSLAYAENNFWSQRFHREDLKIEARISHLAYGCMKGVPYSAMENICYGVYKGHGSTEPAWSRIEAMVERFSKDEPSPQHYMQRYAEWLVDAKKWYDGNIDRILKLAETRSERIKPKKPYVAPTSQVAV